jgi:hypothetical protein
LMCWIHALILGIVQLCPSKGSGFGILGVPSIVLVVLVSVGFLVSGFFGDVLITGMIRGLTIWDGGPSSSSGSISIRTAVMSCSGVLWFLGVLWVSRFLGDGSWVGGVGALLSEEALDARLDWRVCRGWVSCSREDRGPSCRSSRLRGATVPVGKSLRSRSS